MNKARCQTRDSNMELLRIISILTIIFYHLLVFTHEELSDSSIYQALYLPFHVGVLLFVMISGYYHIRFSIKKLIMIIVPMFIYSSPSVIYHLIDKNYKQISISDFLFISHSQYWYMRIYIELFLLSPLINKYLDTCNKSSRFILFFVLCYIATYCGITNGDPSLYAGKNIVNFILLYLIGDTFNHYNNRIKQISPKIVFLAYLFLNILLVSTFCSASSMSISHVIYRMSFQYCSPLLLINSTLIFYIFTRINFTSSLINYTSKSVLAIYLIHSNNVVFPKFIAPIIIKLFNYDSVIVSLLGLIMLTLIVFFVCVIIDKSLSPIWCFAEKIAKLIDKKIRINYI